MSIIKIKAINAENGDFKEKILVFNGKKQKYCLIGRHPSCDLVLDSAAVSRIHGRIWVDGGQSFYADLASTDGSQIDEHRVEIEQVYLLKQHDLLKIGNFVLTIAQLPNGNIATQGLESAADILNDSSNHRIYPVHAQNTDLGSVDTTLKNTQSRRRRRSSASHIMPIQASKQDQQMHHPQDFPTITKRTQNNVHGQA